MVRHYVNHGVPFLRSRDVEPFRIRTDSLMHISEELHRQQLRKSSLTPGDVVIVRTGQPGTAAVVPQTLPIANCADLVIVRPGPNIDARFLAYYLNSAAKGYVSAHVVGAVQQHFNVGSVKALTLALPTIEEQRRIAGVLGALDDKAEAAQKTNSTLSDIARLRYRMLAASHGGTRRPLLDFAAVVSGGTPKTVEPTYWSGPIPWFSVADSPRLDEVFVMRTERTITEAGLTSCATAVLPEFSTILTARGTVGNVALTGVRMAMNQSCYGLVPYERAGSAFVYYSTLEAVAELQRRSHGSTFSTITRSTLAAIDVAAPQKSSIDVFEGSVEPLLLQIRSNLQLRSTLESIRDALLPKLVSGAVRVPVSYDPDDALGTVADAAGVAVP